MNLADYAARTDVGKRRDHNEDAVLAAAPLFAVADGVGGASYGEEASQLALETLQVAIEAPHDGTAEERLHDAIEQANAAVFERQHEDPKRGGMATTLTAALIVAQDELILGHVGDSRAYVISPSGAEQISDDHSVVGELVRSGELSEDEARTHPQRNVILRALGSDATVDIDIQRVHVPAGSWLLLCSDGLTGHVEPHELLEALLPGDGAQAAAQRLIALANARGGSDNISVVLVKLDRGGDWPTKSSAAPAQLQTEPWSVAEQPPAQPDGSDTIPELEEPDDPLEAVPYVDRTSSSWRISRRTRRVWLGILALVAALVVLAAVWEQSYYLVVRPSGVVGANHGFPVLGLHTDYRTTSVKAKSLSEYDHDRLLSNHTLRSKDSVNATLDQLIAGGDG